MQRKAERENRGSQLCSEEKQAISHEEQSKEIQNQDDRKVIQK